MGRRAYQKRAVKTTHDVWRIDHRIFDALPQSTDAARHAAEAVLPEALTPLLGVAPFPGRHGCAMLPWQALREALAAKR